jgi:hypothetical protein
MKLFKDADNNIYAYELDGSQDHLIGDKTSISDAEADAIRAEKQAARPYTQKRADEYPSFADQFDLLYHGGMDAWKAAIQTVKDKYPKA